MGTDTYPQAAPPPGYFTAPPDMSAAQLLACLIDHLVETGRPAHIVADTDRGRVSLQVSLLGAQAH